MSNPVYHKILLVDDNEATHEIYKSIFEEDLSIYYDKEYAELFGDHSEPIYFTITSAFNGKEAIELLANESFSIIVLDLVMPCMDGFQTLKIINKFWVNIPIILITTYDLPELESPLRKGYKYNKIFHKLRISTSQLLPVFVDLVT